MALTIIAKEKEQALPSKVSRLHRPAELIFVYVIVGIIAVKAVVNGST